MGNERLCPGRLDVATSAPRPGRVKRPRHDGWALPGAPQQRCRPAPVNAFLQRHQDEGSHCNQVQWLSASSPRESQWPAGLQPGRRGSRRGLAKTARLGPSPKGVGWQARTGVRVVPTYPLCEPRAAGRRAHDSAVIPMSTATVDVGPMGDGQDVDPNPSRLRKGPTRTVLRLKLSPTRVGGRLQRGRLGAP
jgi:hypothetical protein